MFVKYVRNQDKKTALYFLMSCLCGWIQAVRWPGGKTVYSY